eukprot:superscaffoldBa00011420_g25207
MAFITKESSISSSSHSQVQGFGHWASFPPPEHETASLQMFDYLVDDNDLKPVMEQYGLKLPEDQTFITEMFAGPLDTNAAQGQTVPASVKLCVINSVFEKILNPSSSELAEARKILEKIISRQLYKFLGQTKAKRLPEGGAVQNRRNDERFIDVTEEIISTWKEELAQAVPDAQDGLNPEDFEIIKVTINYGKKDQNPVDDVYFYSKNDHTRAFQIPQEQ